MRSSAAVLTFAFLLYTSVYGLPLPHHGHSNGEAGAFQQGGFAQEEEYGNREKTQEESGSRTHHKSGSSNLGVHSGLVSGIGGGLAAGLEGVSVGLGTGLIQGGQGASGAFNQGLKQGVLGVSQNYNEDESESFNNRKHESESFGHGIKKGFGQAGKLKTEHIREKRDFGFGNFGGGGGNFGEGGGGNFGFGNFGNWGSGNRGQSAGFQTGGLQQQQQFAGHMKTQEQTGSKNKHKSGSSKVSINGATLNQNGHGLASGHNGGSFNQGNFEAKQEYKEDENESFNNKQSESEFVGQGQQAGFGQAGAFSTQGGTENNDNGHSRRPGNKFSNNGGFQMGGIQQEQKFAGHMKTQEQSGSRNKQKSGSSNISVNTGSANVVSGEGVDHKDGQSNINQGDFQANQEQKEDEDDNSSKKIDDSELIGEGIIDVRFSDVKNGTEKNNHPVTSNAEIQKGAVQKSEEYGGKSKETDQNEKGFANIFDSNNNSQSGTDKYAGCCTREASLTVRDTKDSAEDSSKNIGSFQGGALTAQSNYNEKEDESFNNKKSESESFGHGQSTAFGQGGGFGFQQGGWGSGGFGSFGGQSGGFGNFGNNNSGSFGAGAVAGVAQQQKFGGHMKTQEQSGSHTKHKSGSSNISVKGGTVAGNQAFLSNLQGSGGLTNLPLNSATIQAGNLEASQNYNEDESEDFNNKNTETDIMGEGQAVGAVLAGGSATSQ